MGKTAFAPRCPAAYCRGMTGRVRPTPDAVDFYAVGRRTEPLLLTGLALRELRNGSDGCRTSS